MAEALVGTLDDRQTANLLKTEQTYTLCGSPRLNRRLGLSTRHGQKRLSTLHSTHSGLVTIDQLRVEYTGHYATMKVSEKQALLVRCPTCGAKPGEKCELSTGLPRTDPHRDRRLAASDK